MTTPNSDPNYIVHEYYNDVKRQFKRTENFSHNKEDFEKIIEYINVDPNQLKLLDKIFIRLLKILKNYDAFYNDHMKKNYCIFVNFWLNEEVRKIHNLVNNINFNIFHNFVVKFNKDTYNKLENTCYGYINLLKDEVYNRMEILNSLYNLYNDIKPQKGSPDNNVCSTLNLMRHHYENAVDKHKGDENFFNKLKELKHLIEGNEWASNTTCLARYYIKLPEQNSPQLREETEASKPSKASPQGSESQHLSRAQDKVLLEGDSVTQESRRPSDTRDVSDTSDLLGSHGEEATRHTSGLPYALGPSMPELQAEPENDELFKTTERSAMRSNEQIFTPPGYDKAYTGVMMRNVDGRITELNSNPHTIPKDGLLDKVQDFFTGTLGQVDPVPVVGVSGGMGALFLLFRYTPVGAFFRGGRGRAHRIPRSFNGQFLGGFPGYEEYDVGHILYGPMNPLAE
ncbi:Plasmodium vivax Vir protein, putative [Plasmodium vivax]|uniref:Vir protein, putative n=2 Tax=Plasmodium vivax TaxID=5855 RepID=A0A1G4E6W6_PLAVI|nr:Plasmodium vivax Vir protein, putative [Plasmodium vivax]